MPSNRSKLTRSVNLTGILFLVLPLSAFSQGEFLHKGTSGFNIDLSYINGKKLIYEDLARFSGPGMAMGFSVRGVFDLQAGMFSENIPENQYGAGSEKDLGTHVYGRMVIHAPKQSDHFPLSLRGMFSYGYAEYDEANATESVISLGMGVTRRLYLADNISVIPSVDFLYSRSEFVSTDASRENLDADEVCGIVSIPLAFNLVRNHLLYITPLVSSGMKNSNAHFRITLGYLMPLYFRRK